MVLCAQESWKASWAVFVRKENGRLVITRVHVNFVQRVVVLLQLEGAKLCGSECV